MRWAKKDPSQIPAVERAMSRVAEQIVDDARNLAPYQTGRLRRSLTSVRHVESGRVTFRVGWDTDIAPYGGMVEFGTEDTSAKAHIRPAGQKLRRRKRR